MIKSYSELITLNTYRERLEYLMLFGIVTETTFGSDRLLNQMFYRTRAWKDVRDYVIERDDGMDLGIPNRPILDRITVHHINPISIAMIHEKSDIILNPENLICVSERTHKIIHYSREIPVEYVPRRPNDTKLW